MAVIRHGVIAIALMLLALSFPTMIAAESAALVYHGNTKSRIFHRPGCRYYDCSACTRDFSSREQAVDAGFKPCGICKP